MSQIVRKLAYVFFALVWLFFVVPSADANRSDYSVSFTDREISAGDTIFVEWTAPRSRRDNHDWIGIYRTGTGDRSYVAWKYLPKNGSSGTIRFSYEKTGTYEVRLFTNNDYTRVAVGSKTLKIEKENDRNRDRDYGVPPTNSGSYTVSVGAGPYRLRETVTVNFTTPSPRTSTRDWIGIYRAGAGDRSYVAWKYLPSSGTAGNVSFNLRSAGTYEVRLFSNNSYTRVAKAANTFTVKDEDTGSGNGTYELSLSASSINTGQSVVLSYESPASDNRSRDWVGMYKPGTSNRSYLAWQYVGSRSDGSLTFTPDAAGTYEFRYFKNNGYTLVATSPRLTVTDSGSGVSQCLLSNSALNSITNYPPSNGPMIAFGDSLTAGNGSTAGQDYVSQLSRKAGVSILNAGVSGDTTRDALARLERDVLSRDPSVVIVWLGGNDILQRYFDRVRQGAENPGLIETIRLLIMRITGKLPDSQGITEDETFANLREVIERIQLEGAVVIVVGFSGGVFDSNLENRYRAVAAETNAIYVPNVLQNIIGRPRLMSDLVHPNNRGYGLVADRVLPYLACVI